MSDDTRKRPWAADGDDFENWFCWMWSQPNGPIVLADTSTDHDESLYAIMCRLADGEGKA